MSISRSAAKRCGVFLRHLRQAPPTMSPTSAISSSATDEVLFDRVPAPSSGRGCYNQITLNRPKALNALNNNMVLMIQKHINSAEHDDAVQCYVMKGSGDKAFCAGGDIRAVTDAGRTGDPLAQAFFRNEYILNHTIGTLTKPHIAIIDGVTMGGGVGLSVHGPFRVATEKTLFAMPETAIGLFPDVGGTYFLPRLQGSLGMFMALTGHRIKGRDVYHAGIATHYIPRDKLPELERRLSEVCGELCEAKKVGRVREGVVRRLLDQFHEESLHLEPNEFSLSPYISTINRCFSQPSLEGILDALTSDGSDWAMAQHEKLQGMSPTSMMVTHRQLSQGKSLSFKECFMMEYRMSQGCINGKDFYEGVRAVIVDKDNAPKWDPPTLAEITDEIVDRHFQPPKDGDLIV